MENLAGFFWDICANAINCVACKWVRWAISLNPIDLINCQPVNCHWRLQKCTRSIDICVFHLIPIRHHGHWPTVVSKLCAIGISRGAFTGVVLTLMSKPYCMTDFMKNRLWCVSTIAGIAVIPVWCNIDNAKICDSSIVINFAWFLESVIPSTA